MNRAILRISLQNQAATALGILGIVFDDNARRNPGDDVPNLHIVRSKFLGPVERDSHFVARHQRPDAVKSLAHARTEAPSPRTTAYSNWSCTTPSLTALRRMRPSSR